MHSALSDDNPTIVDTLKRAALLKRVADHVKTCPTPQVIGIFGDWGSGKTSFLARLQLYLSGTSTQFGKTFDEDSDDYSALVKLLNIPGSSEGFPVVWFEAWRYQNEPQPVVALLQEIRKQFSPGSKLWNFVKKESQVALETALLSLDPITKFIGSSAKHAREVGERYERDTFSVQPSTSAIRAQLDEAIKTIAKSLDDTPSSGLKLFSSRSSKALRQRKLVVIIDDLDRCEPEAAWKLLEGIKIFLNLHSTVFVLGMNQQILEDHLASLIKKKEDKDNDSEVRFRAREYLEKLCPHPYHLPMAVDCAELIDDCLWPDGNEAIRTPLLAYAKTYLPRNPRKIKAFANILGRFASLCLPTSATDDAKAAFVLSYLYYFHHRLYRKVEQYPAFYEERLVVWAKTGQSEMEELKSLTLLHMIPPKGATDTTSDSQTSPTPASVTLIPSYADPVLDNLFHIQSLVSLTALTERHMKWLEEN